MKPFLTLILLASLVSCTPDFWASFEKAQTTHVLVIGDSQSTSIVGEGTAVKRDSTLFYWSKRAFHNIEMATGFYPEMAHYTYGTLYVHNQSKGSTDVTRDWGSTGGYYEVMRYNASLYIEANREYDFILLALGGWDALRSYPIADFEREYLWLVTQLRTDFPDTKILLSKAPGGDKYSARMRAVREIQTKVIESDSMIYQAYDIGALVDEYGREEIGRDTKHLKQQWSDTVGKYNGLLINDLKY